MGISKLDALVIDVLNNKGNFWSAYDQGRWAYLRGTPRGNNPHFSQAGWHINEADWERGWDYEAGRDQKGE